MKRDWPCYFWSPHFFRHLPTALVVGWCARWLQGGICCMTHLGKIVANFAQKTNFRVPALFFTTRVLWMDQKISMSYPPSPPVTKCLGVGQLLLLLTSSRDFYHSSQLQFLFTMHFPPSSLPHLLVVVFIYQPASFCTNRCHGPRFQLVWSLNCW